MPRRLPPLNALKAFEAAARHESFTRAAEELCVTQGAVSHQVKALELELGVKLFNRERQRLVITEAGREYLDRGARRARPHRARHRAPAAAAELRRAHRQHVAGLRGQMAGATASAASPRCIPSIDLRVSATMHHVDFAREDVDLAVRHGDGNWPGLDVVRLAPRSCSRSAARSCWPGALA